MDASEDPRLSDAAPADSDPPAANDAGDAAAEVPAADVSLAAGEVVDADVVLGAEGGSLPADDADVTASAAFDVQTGDVTPMDAGPQHEGYAFRPFDAAVLPAPVYSFEGRTLEATEGAGRLVGIAPVVPIFASVALANAANAAAPEPALVPTDPLYNQQWHLQAINVESVWNDYTGAGVLIGVIDDGVEYTHPDLAANYDTSLDYDARNNDNDAFSSSSSDAHGTSTSGTIAAVQGNGTGVVGVAYGATITGFRMGFGSAGSTSQIAANLQHALNVDIANNSWGYNGYFPDNFNSSSFAASGAAIENAAENGRGGLGTVFVFSAGNARTSGNDTNFHNFTNSKYVIAVGATDESGDVTYFSTPGVSILVSAPGLDITTVDRVGSLGFSSGDYATLSGTSFSAPIVSGVIALMLEANPDLGYRDVQEILAYSSVKTDPTNSRWHTNGATNWNGGGLHFSADYGFGLVDAHAAVRLAETWTDQSTAANMVMASASYGTPVTIPDNSAAGVSRSVTIAPGIEIDKIELDISISHTWIGQLRVVLIAPDGTQSVLVDQPGVNPDTGSGSGTSQDNINFTLTSNEFWGEDSGGTWTVVVQDVVGGRVGTLNNFELRVFGDPASADDLYVYTDEYAGFTGAANAAHRLLTDGNGGDDTINASAVTGSSFIDLTPGGSGQIAGNAFSIAGGTTIENAFMGDGNDTVIGNIADNLILGGRGNDSLSGGDGNDTLGGGTGNDNLLGGNGDDTALFSGFFADYSVVVVDPTHLTVTDNVTADGNDGVDQLFDIENLQFADFLYVWNSGPVNTPPVAGTDPATTDEDNSVSVNVLSNDSDDDGDILSVTGVTNGAHGTVSIDGGNASVTYTPEANYHGPDSFTYTVSDGHGGSDTGTVNVTVNSVNDSPVAGDDTATTSENDAVSVAVLGNDNDVDGDILSVTEVTNGAHGTVSIDGGNASVTYTPDTNYNGPDSFTYTVSDGNGGTDTATVDVTVTPVNQDPVAGNDTAVTNEDNAVVVNVLSNDNDDDGDILSVSSVGGAAHGTVTIDGGNASVTYTPDANYHGPDSFTYTVSDGHGGSDTATVDVTVNSVNDSPVAGNDTAVTSENDSVSMAVLGNDNDVDGDTLTVSSVGSATHGTVTIDGGNTSITYTPDTNYNGPDSFTYTVSDGNGGTDTATVDITVNPVNQDPVAGDDTAVTDEDNAVVVNVLGNDNDDDGDILSVSSVGGAAHGTVSIDGGNASVAYSPNANYNGPDSFTYTVSDGKGGTDTATVNVTVNPVNDNPVATDDVAITLENAQVVIPVLGNDNDIDGGALSVSDVSDPTHGTASINVDGTTVTYTPDSGYDGPDSFIYTVSDGNGGTDTATVDVTVNPVNDPPVAGDDTAGTVENSPVVIDVLSNDNDPDGDILSVTGTTTPDHGGVVINLDGTVTYTPTNGYSGADSFDYFISDGNGGTDQATVDLTISPAPPPPAFLINEDFNSNAGGFAYFDDAFFGTNEGRYESGDYVSSGGFTGGALAVTLGGVNNRNIDDMSGGFEHSFNLSQATDVTLTFRYDLTMNASYDTGDFSQVLAQVDGTLYGTGGNDYVDQVNAVDGSGTDFSTGWQTVTIDLGVLSPGDHTLVLGGFNNAKSGRTEETTLLLDDVSLSTGPGSSSLSLSIDSTAPLDDAHSSPLDLSDVLGGGPADSAPSPDASPDWTDLDSGAAAPPASLASLVVDDAAQAAAQAGG